jgi:uncharacterized protein YjbJ (UPF0337 family)
VIDTDIRTKWDQLQSGAQQRWSKLTTEDLVQIRDDVNRLAGLVQQRYGYTTERAQAEADKFLDNYDHRVYQLAHTLPGQVDRKLMRRPWASIATAFMVGVATGWITRPGHHRSDDSAQSRLRV